MDEPCGVRHLEQECGQPATPVRRWYVRCMSEQVAGDPSFLKNTLLFARRAARLQGCIQKVLLLRKWLLLVMIFSILLSSSAVAEYNYQRTDTPLPVIGNVLAEIQNATGWVKGSTGQWIGCKNAINEYADVDWLDIDNFTFLQIRTVQIGSEQYYLLIRQHTSHDYASAFFCVFTREQRDTIAVSGDIPIEPLLVRIKPLVCGDVAGCRYSPAEKDFLDSVRDELQRLILTKDQDTDGLQVLFNILPIRRENRCFFVLSAIGTASRYDLLYDESSPDIFQKYYYEVSFDTFNSFIPLVK